MYLASPNGWCERPQVDLFSYDFILSGNGQIVPEDVNPSIRKLQPVSDGYILHSVSGIRTHIVSRLDGKGYDVTKLGPHAVRSGQIVYVNDSDLVLGPKNENNSVDSDGKRYPRHLDIQLRFYLDAMAPMFKVQAGIVESPSEVLVPAYPSFFGADLTSLLPSNADHVRFARGEGVRVTRDKTNVIGCLPYSRTFNNDAVLVYRGECTFLQKLVRAKSAGASGVLVINDDEAALNPTSDPEEIAAAGDLSDVALVALTHSAGKLITSMLDVADAHGMSQVILTIDPDGQSATTDGRRMHDAMGRQGWEHMNPDRVLYINGHALLNTRLLI